MNEWMEWMEWMENVVQIYEHEKYELPAFRCFFLFNRKVKKVTFVRAFDGSEPKNKKRDKCESKWWGRRRKKKRKKDWGNYECYSTVWMHTDLNKHLNRINNFEMHKLNQNNVWVKRIDRMTNVTYVRMWIQANVFAFSTTNKQKKK